MLLFTYFDGATGPVQPVGRTNYTESYCAAEVRGQAKRQALPDVRELLQLAEGWPKGCWGPNYVSRKHEAEKLARGEIKQWDFEEHCQRDIFTVDAEEVQALQRQANWQRLCDEMRKVVEGKL